MVMSSRRGGVVDGGVVPGPAVVGQVHVGRPAQHDGLEVVHPLLLPPGPEPLGEVGRGGAVAPHPDGGGRALEHVDVAGRRRQRTQALDAGGAGPDERHDLIAQLGHGLARCAAGVAVVPAGRVERPTLEVLHARDGGQLEQVEDPDRQHVVATRHLVAAVGADLPPSGSVIPPGAGHAGVEEGVGAQVVAGRRSPGGAAGSPRPTRTGGSGRSRAPRASAGRCTTPRRTSPLGSGSSTRSRPRPLPGRRCRLRSTPALPQLGPGQDPRRCRPRRSPRRPPRPAARGRGAR